MKITKTYIFIDSMLECEALFPFNTIYTAVVVLRKQKYHQLREKWLVDVVDIESDFDV